MTILKEHTFTDSLTATVTEMYGPIHLTEDEFDKIIAIMRLKMVKLRIVKKPILLRNSISKLGSLRDMLVIPEIIDDSLFARLGKMEGLQSIVDHVFDNVKENP